MEKHELLSDEEFVEQFTQGKINKITFTHDAQLRLTWLLLNKFGRSITTEKIIEKISEISNSKKVEIVFDEKLVRQTIRVLDIYRRGSNSDSFQSFLRKYPNIQVDTVRLFTFNYNQ